MPRPTIDAEVLERLEAVADDRTKVPVDHLSTTQRLDFVLDELADVSARADHLESRVESLEAQVEDLEEELAATQSQSDTSGGPIGGGVGGATGTRRNNQF